jgi:hypothetical protein
LASFDQTLENVGFGPKAAKEGQHTPHHAPMKVLLLAMLVGVVGLR